MSPLADRATEEFWEIIRKLDAAARQTGLAVPSLEATLRDLSMFDCDHVRQVARDAWGTGGAYPGRPGQVATGVPDSIITVTTKVGERWTGAAWTAFEKSMTDVRALIGKLTEPAQQLGLQLESAADDMEMGWTELVGWVLTIGGLVVTAVFWETGVGAVVGLVITLIGVLVDAFASVVPRVLAVSDLLSVLEKDMREKIPSVPDAPVGTPGAGDWDRRTADPDT
jgi:hypothetical protein